MLWTPPSSTMFHWLFTVGRRQMSKKTIAILLGIGAVIPGGLIVFNVF